MTEDEAKMLARAFVAELRSLLGSPASLAPPAGEPRFMKVSAYAKSRGLARSTVQEHLKKGMPCVVLPGGRRVEPAKADEWLRLGGASREMSS